MQFNVLHLLSNEVLRLGLYENNESYMLIKMPTIGQIHLDSEMSMALNLFMSDDDVLFKNQNKDITRIDFLNYFLLMSENKEVIINKIKAFITNFDFKEEAMSVNNIKLTNNDLNNIKDLLQLGFGSMTFDQYKNKKNIEQNEESLSEEEKRMIELEKKVQAKKQQGKEESQDDGNFSIEKIIIAVIYEYKLTMQEVFNLNYFTLF